MNVYNPIEILFIEDNPHEAELTIRSLKKNNLANALKHIDDGAEALDFIFARGIYADREFSPNPKLIILDLKLPKVDGLEILHQIKNHPKTQSIPVAVLTSSQEEKDIIESYKLGVNSYIVKPVNFESFSKAVADLGLYWMILNQSPNA
ncbi:response regulator [Terrimonas alba]|uniref:response regulator n=1 Tax=Terrimonas alba TaxID=3349636 RepID=UPI0035F40BC5